MVTSAKGKGTIRATPKGPSAKRKGKPQSKSTRKLYTFEIEYLMSIVDNDEFAQRELKSPRVDALYDKFDVNAMGTPTLALNPDGETYHVVDGFTRLNAYYRYLKENPDVEDDGVVCVTIEGLTSVEIMDLFLKLNDTESVKPQVKYTVAYAQGDPTKVAIQDIIFDQGYSYLRGANGFVNKGTHVEIQAVDALAQAYEAGVLEQAIRVLRESTIRNPINLEGKLEPIGGVPIRVMSYFLKKFRDHPHFDEDQLIRILANVSAANKSPSGDRTYYGLDAVIALAKEQGVVNGGRTRSEGGALFMQALYNQNLPRGKRPIEDATIRIPI